MFGHQNSDDNSNAATSAPTTDAPVNSHEPTTIAPSVVGSAPVIAHSNDAGDYTATNLPQPISAAPPSTPPIITAPVADPVSQPAPVVHGAPASAALSGDLAELKQSALHELSPLIGHLEQSPEEKFRTTMMMIQASDDQSMLPTALAAAKQIHDEKARAQALLDVVNEINYFTQQHDA